MSILAITCKCSAGVVAAIKQTNNSHNDTMRIVSLSPHLSELVFALEQQRHLVAVSDYSNYPFAQGCIDEECKTQLPSVASYQGADIARIIRLKPTIVLAWEGGNKAQDIARLEQLGYQVFRSSPASIGELMQEILSLGSLINANDKAEQLHQEMRISAQTIQDSFAKSNTKALYYMSQQPLSGIGSDAWLNALLSMCNIENIYAALPSPYAQFSLADVIRKQAKVVIAATHEAKTSVDAFWAPHAAVYQPKVVTVNPDALHRFTPRVLPELARLCKSVYF